MMNIASRFSALLLAAAGTLPSTAATTNVSFGSFFFNPKVVTVEPGDTVTWNNLGGTHTVTGTGADPICGPGLVNPSCSHTFLVPGSYPYICAVPGHASSGMTGLVNVVAAPVVPATLSDPVALPNGDFQFTILSTANRTNVVQATTNATSPSAWSPIATVVPATNQYIFTDSNANTLPLRFYRVVQP